MDIRKIFYLVLFAAFITNCSSKPEMKKAFLEGTITVADSIDNSKDYSGIQLIITYQESADNPIDTLFNESSDINGFIKGKVEFPQKGVYPVFVKRNGNELASTQFILADNDTLKFTGELPGLDKNFELDSREQRAMNTFNRIDRGFKRVAAYINAGAIADSLIYDEILKWSDLFWEVTQRNKNTIAASLSASESIRLLNIIDKEKMMGRIDDALQDDEMIFAAVNYGFPFISDQNGLDIGLTYLDSLAELTQNDELILGLEQKKIEVLYDSSRVEEAKAALEKFEKIYKNKENAMQWAKNIGYDLAYLAPGFRVPDFSFVTQEGDSVNSTRLIGKPYIIEITPVASSLYQDQYDRTVVLHQIYQNYDLEIFTIPLDRSEITVNAFFEERVRHWDIASFGSFDIQKLIETFNVTDVPTRILVDQNGNIVRKYVTTEFTDVIQGMNSVINQNKKEN
ncbi:MAG: thioredoxin family protein [Balneola sp.]|nr:thioredoxin family protein [Balneola sp.]MBO6650958.1 thioredoxin family protein [Balneola sp.]MBO6711119.1 thioredoxin family protein [Balneola sp.]MBO6800767.1 thioredoxin family protein [Balneola sp.]MBO6869054.1 thioredoxin family protein [Balneola sp.]